MFLHSVYIGFRLCAFGEAFGRHVFDALEGTRDSCGRNVLLACSPARPRPAALPCAPTRPACGILGHALHEKGLQRQKGVGSTGQQPETKSASRSGDKPRINRLSTGDFVSAFGLHRISLVRASGETFRRRFVSALEGMMDPCLLGEQFCWHLVLPDSRPAAPPCAPTRPARGMSGFWTRQVSGFWTRQVLVHLVLRSFPASGRLEVSCLANML